MKSKKWQRRRRNKKFKRMKRAFKRLYNVDIRKVIPGRPLDGYSFSRAVFDPNPLIQIFYGRNNHGRQNQDS